MTPSRYGLGSRFGGSRNTSLGGAVALGVAGAGVAYALNSCVLEVAAANFHNGVVEGGASFISNLVDLGNRLAVEIYNSNQDFCELCPPLLANFRPKTHHNGYVQLYSNANSTFLGFIRS
ncbi:protein TIC [Forsythia ovata]|uniref:Protein TIC n=1 Tax=Forsythia ovata TaxID=205694 RepID=A0ABD1S5Z8_9LAMI